MKDQRIILTLDAGGTNFAFSALKNGEEVCDPISLPAYATNQQKSIETLLSGFQHLIDQLNDKPSAISFAFPGPADYPNGITYNVGNLPAYAGGVPIGPLLEEHFNIPVYINNDADLFTYGEAIMGVLPEINQKLEEANSPKRFNNLLGLTLGTGFGAGIVRNGGLFLGDNSCGAEIWLVRNYKTKSNMESSISIRGIIREYKRLAQTEEEDLTPKCIYEIAKGERDGDQEAALESYEIFGAALGEAIANVATLIDGIVVIGGGLSGAKDIFMPSVMNVLNSNIQSLDNTSFPRIHQRVYDLEDTAELKQFLKGETKEIKIPGTDKKLTVDCEQRIGVCFSKMGTNQATSFGAYTYAINQLDK